MHSTDSQMLVGLKFYVQIDIACGYSISQTQRQDHCGVRVFVPTQDLGVKFSLDGSFIRRAN